MGTRVWPRSLSPDTTVGTPSRLAGATVRSLPVPGAILSALSLELRRLEALAARAPDPDDAEVEQLGTPVRDELRRLADELERRACEHLAQDGAVYLFWDTRHSTPERARDPGNELADRLREGGFSVDSVLVEDLRPVPAVCAIGRPQGGVTRLHPVNGIH